MKHWKLMTLLLLSLSQGINLTGQRQIILGARYNGTPLNGDGLADTTYVQNWITNALNNFDHDAYDKQKIDALSLVGNELQISLERDGEATKALDLSGLSSQSIYTDNGTLTGDRTVGLSTYDLIFDGGDLIFHYDRSEVYSPTSSNSAIATIRNYNTSTAYTPSLLRFQSRGSTTTTTMWEIGNTGQDASYSESDFVIKNRINGSSYAERMKIEGGGNVLMAANGGNVGIGTTSPSAKLHISDGTNASTLINDASFRISKAAIQAAGVESALHIDVSPNSTSYDRGISIDLGPTYNGLGEYTSRIIHYGSPSTTRATKMQLQTHSSSQGIWNTGLLIDHLGDVGIGTTSPSAALDVVGDVQFDDYGSESIGGSTAGVVLATDVSGNIMDNTEIYTDGSGNVGIGTTSPSSYLGGYQGLVINKGNAGLALTGSAFASLLLGNAADPDEGGLIYDITNNKLRFYAGGTERLSIVGDKVGIGTTTPEAALHVNGSIRTENHNQYLEMAGNGGYEQGVKGARFGTFGTNFYFDYFGGDAFFRGGATTLTLTQGNKVGIGTTTPSEKLDVVGNIEASGTITGSAFYGDGSNLTGITASDDQTIDVSTHTSSGINLSLEGDEEATKVIPILSTTANNSLTYNSDGIYINNTFGASVDGTGTIGHLALPQAQGTVDFLINPAYYATNVPLNITRSQKAPISIIATDGSTIDIAILSESLTCTDLVAENIDGGSGTFTVSTAASGSTSYTTKYTSASTALNGAINASITDFTGVAQSKVKFAATGATFTITLECTR